MDSRHVSPEIIFLLEGNETISFSSSSLHSSQKPAENQLRKYFHKSIKYELTEKQLKYIITI